MHLSLWVHRISGRFRASQRISRPRSIRPGVELLEDRLTPATFTPTTFADDGTANSLRGAITQANNDTSTAADTIQLQAGTYTLTLANSSGQENLGKEGDLDITSTSHALVIQGAVDPSGKPTTIIQQTVADRVFQIVNPGTTVTFKDLVIEGGKAQDDGTATAAAGQKDALGGGILDDGGDVTLSNVVVKTNTAVAISGHDARGGGIYAVNGSLTLQSSVVQSNTASGGNAATTTTNGGIAQGGGIYAQGATNILHSTLSGNFVLGGQASGGEAGSASGGAVYVQGTTTITDSSLSGNTLLGGSSSAGNSGSASGGGIYAEGTTTLTDSSMSDNTLAGGPNDNADGGVALGGGIYAAGTTTLTGCTLSGNKLFGGDSKSSLGGIVRGGGAYDRAGPMTITDSTLSANKLTGGGSNISTLVDDGGDGGGDAEGGGVFSADGGTTDISASILSGNTLTGGDGSLRNSGALVRGDLGGAARGGGIYVEFVSAATIRNSILSGNTLKGGSGSLFMGTVKGGIGGSAQGGGVYVYPDSTATATILASTLADNTLTGGAASNSAGVFPSGLAQGGGAYLGGPGNQIVNSTIANNQANGGQELLANTPGGGGLFLDTAATATLTNDTVAGNKATLLGDVGNTVGGGIDTVNVAMQAITLTNTLVANNIADGETDYAGYVSTGSGHNLIGIAEGIADFSAARGDLLGSLVSPLDPHLGTLTNNGGASAGAPTSQQGVPTMALLSGSPALDAGDNAAQSITGPFDQRGSGFTRVANGTIDVGAFEVQPPPAPPSSPPPSSPPLSPPSAPPSLLQALITLYIDGIELEAFDQANVAGFKADFNTAAALERVLAFFGNPSPSAIQASIAFNEQFAGPFGPLVVMAGQRAVDNALQQMSAST